LGGKRKKILRRNQLTGNSWNNGPKQGRWDQNIKGGLFWKKKTSLEETATGKQISRIKKEKRQKYPVK